MATPHEVQKIVGQKYPRFEWFQLGCDVLYPHLKPFSDVGRVSLSLAARRAKHLQQLKRYGEKVGGGFIDFDEQHTELNDAFTLADDRHNMATNLYGNMERILLDTDILGDPITRYEQAISEATLVTQENIFVLGRAVAVTRELVQLTDRLGMYYRLESNIHFRELLGKTS